MFWLTELVNFLLHGKEGNARKSTECWKLSHLQDFPFLPFRMRPMKKNSFLVLPSCCLRNAPISTAHHFLPKQDIPFMTLYLVTFCPISFVMVESSTQSQYSSRGALWTEYSLVSVLNSNFMGASSPLVFEVVQFFARGPLRRTLHMRGQVFSIACSSHSKTRDLVASIPKR